MSKPFDEKEFNYDEGHVVAALSIVGFFLFALLFFALVVLMYFTWNVVFVEAFDIGRITFWGSTLLTSVLVIFKGVRLGESKNK